MKYEAEIYVHANGKDDCKEFRVVGRLMIPETVEPGAPIRLALKQLLKDPFERNNEPPNLLPAFPIIVRLSMREIEGKGRQWCADDAESSWLLERHFRTK
ncbi:MAG: hypothetical protein AAF720_00975 [Pseudomonadota bacterium]